MLKRSTRWISVSPQVANREEKLATIMANPSIPRGSNLEMAALRSAISEVDLPPCQWIFRITTGEFDRRG